MAFPSIGALAGSFLLPALGSFGSKIGSGAGSALSGGSGGSSGGGSGISPQALAQIAAMGGQNALMTQAGQALNTFTNTYAGALNTLTNINAKSAYDRFLAAQAKDLTQAALEVTQANTATQNMLGLENAIGAQQIGFGQQAGQAVSKFAEGTALAGVGALQQSAAKLGELFGQTQGMQTDAIGNALAAQNKNISDLATVNKAIRASDANFAGQYNQTFLNVGANAKNLENQTRAGLIQNRALTTSQLARGKQQGEYELAKGKQAIMGQQFLRDRARGAALNTMSTFA